MSNMDISAKTVLIDFWYQREMRHDFVSFENLIRAQFNQKTSDFILKNWMARTLAFFWLGRKFDVIIPEWNIYGRSLCVLQGLFGRRKVVMLECIDYANLNKADARARILKFLTRWLFRPTMSRSILALQTMTEKERLEFASRYGIDKDRITCIKWPLYYQPAPPEAFETAGLPVRYAFSSGRSSCDWPTVFSASRLGGWPLVVVCAGKDLDAVKELNHDNIAYVLSDIPEAHHNYLLSRAEVNIISLLEKGTSTGHIRLGTSIALRVPAVATAVEGLSEYIADGVNGVSVPVGRPDIMAEVVSSLMSDPAHREKLVNSAHETSSRFDKRDYFKKVEALVDQAALTSSR